MSAGQNSSPGGMSYVACRKGDRLLVQGVGTPPPDDMERASLSGATPSGFPKRTRGALPYLDSLREKHTALMNITSRTIAYPIRICLSGSLTRVSKPCYFIPRACHSPRSAALQWCVRTPCSDIFAKDSKELSLNLGLLW